MKLRKSNGHDPNNRGENWPKFLKEMQTLAPLINAKLGPSAPANRGEARAQGKGSVKQYLDEEIAKLTERQRFRDWRVNSWFDETMAKLSPWLFSIIRKRSPSWVVLLKLAGYRMSATDGIENGIPYTVCMVLRFGRLKTGIRFYWEDPKREGIPHERH